MKHVIFILLAFALFTACSDEKKEEEVPDWIVGTWKYTRLSEDSLFINNVIKAPECVDLSRVEFKGNGNCFCNAICINEHFSAQFKFRKTSSGDYLEILNGSFLVWGPVVAKHKDKITVYAYSNTVMVFKIKRKGENTSFIELQKIE